MSDTVTETARDFEVEAAAVLSRLRSDLAELIEALPGPVAKAADLQRALSIDMKLSWKLFKVANTPDPLAAGHHVPGHAGLKTFFRSAARMKVPVGLIEAATRTANDFDKLVRIHAGDRSTFDSMISAHQADHASEPIGLMHRRAAFRANSHIWGVQAKTKMSAMIVQPSDQPGKVDIAGLTGFLKLRQLRHGAQLLVARVGNLQDDGTVRHGYVREALDPECDVTSGVALLKRFCSQPTPELRMVNVGGVGYAELVSNGVGNTAAVSCFQGNVARSVAPRYRDTDNRFGQASMQVRTPCEAVVVDLLVREDTFGAIEPEMAVYGEQSGGSSYPAPGSERDLLPIRQPVLSLGKGPSVLHTPDVPRYAEMARFAFDRLGWEAERFDVFRIRIEYPVMPSSVVLRFELPENEPAPQ